MGSVCSTQMIPIIKVDRGDPKIDNQPDKKKVKHLEKELTSSEDKQSKNEKPSWRPPDPTPMPKGIVITPDPCRLTVEDNGARLSVGTRNSGSDSLSPSANSFRSSTDCSVTSSGRSIQILDRGKAPPRLLSLSADLHQLLMGRLDDTSRVRSRPKVIHLELIAPPEDCTEERKSLWQHTFVPLRKMCAEMGYALDLQDDLWTPHNPLSPHAQPFPISDNNVMSDGEDWASMGADVVVILLTEDHTYNLPDHLPSQDFRFLQDAMETRDDSSLLTLLNVLYKSTVHGNDASKYWLQRDEVGKVEKQKVSRLVSQMVLSLQASGVATSGFLSPFYVKLKSTLSNISLLSKRTVVVSRQFAHIMNFDAASGYDFDPTASDDQGELSRMKMAVEKGCDPSRKVKLELPHTDNRFNIAKDANKVYLREMGTSVNHLLKSVVETIVETRMAEGRTPVTGVSRSLIDELITQATRTQRLLRAQPMFYSSTLRSLQEYVINFTEMPIVFYAPPGWGLSTLGAQLIDFCKKEMPNALIMYRSLGVSPDSTTLQSTLLSIHLQLDTILGNKGQWEEEINAFPTKRLLSNIVSRSTSHLPIIIFLEGVTLATSKLKELEIMTLGESLPPTTKLIVMTSDAAVTRGLRLKMKDAFYVKAVPWEKQSIADLFSKTISDKKLVLSESLTTIISNAIKQCPLPLFAVIAAQIVFVRSQNGHIPSELKDFPVTMEGVIKKLFDALENYFPQSCFPWIMAYLCGSVGGISSWEINDLLSMNDSVLQSVFSNEKEQLLLCRAPTILWKSFLIILRPFLHPFLSPHYHTIGWSSSTMNRHATENCIHNSGNFEKVHKDMGHYFEGKWANSKNPFPVSEEKDTGDYSRERFITPQPTKYGSNLNVRKLMCLPSHTMLHDAKNGIGVDKFILNLPWVVYKLDAVSCLQFLIDLELAKSMKFSYAHPNDLDTIQAVVFKFISSLTMCGKEINKILHHSVILSKYKSNRELYKDSVYYTSKSYYEMIKSIDKIPFTYLNPLDKESTSLPQLSPIPSPMINEIVPIHKRSIFVATVLKLEGEIRIINTKTNEAVRTLKGLDKPTTLKMLDDVTCLVLCNRELYVINLDEGTIINKLRTVLNLRKPLFGLQNKERAVVLSRDRMVVNVIDLKTGGIVSSFKAGETRFLESLLVSQDGKMLVCGDETQKPYPLLAWSLEHGKLVHDIRMSQHEFLTDLADITDDGRYLACGCKEVSISDSNFIVLYDLVSGQLLKKFKMSGLVTSLVISSKSLSVIASLDTAQLVVWDMVSGNRRLVMEGVHVIVDSIQLSLDGHRCLTSCRKEYSISAHTLSLWDIEKGRLLGTHTFHAQVTCVHLSWDGCTVLAGVRGHTKPIRLALVSPRDKDRARYSGGGAKEQGSTMKGRDSGEVLDEEFGALTRSGNVIQVSNFR